MAPWLIPFAVSFATITAQPAEPTDPADPTADPMTADPEASMGVPEPEPAPEPEPEPEPVSAEPTTTTTTSVAPGVGTEGNPPDDSPVERASPGLWGMQFTFGGLAPLSIAGIEELAVTRLFFSELGFRRMLGNGWAVPFSVGAGVFHENPDAGSESNHVGLSARVGIRKSFRVWRRIAPYVGGDLRVTYLDPSGNDNWQVGLGFGPLLGIEYFVGDRVSLLLQGDASIGFNIFDGLLQVRAATQMSFGGQMGLIFYF